MSGLNGYKIWRLEVVIEAIVIGAFKSLVRSDRTFPIFYKASVPEIYIENSESRRMFNSTLIVHFNNGIIPCCKP